MNPLFCFWGLLFILISNENAAAENPAQIRFNDIIFRDTSVAFDRADLLKEMNENGMMKLDYKSAKGFQFFYSVLNDTQDLSPEYTLEGFDRQWVPGNSSNQIVYANLDPGLYRLIVRLKKDTSVISQKALEITITPPFWKSFLFRGLVIFCFFIAVIFYLYVIMRK